MLDHGVIVPRMTYLVAVCDACRRVALHPVAGFRFPASFCDCKSALRAVPSRMFAEHERGLFADIASAVNETAVPRTVASALIAHLERAKILPERAEVWERITGRIPALLSMQLVLGNNEAAHRTALEMLRTILEAVSTTRDSGEMPAVNMLGARRSVV